MFIKKFWCSDGIEGRCPGSSLSSSPTLTLYVTTLHVYAFYHVMSINVAVILKMLLLNSLKPQVLKGTCVTALLGLFSSVLAHCADRCDATLNSISS